MVDLANKCAEVRVDGHTELIWSGVTRRTAESKAHASGWRRAGEWQLTTPPDGFWCPVRPCTELDNDMTNQKTLPLNDVRTTRDNALAAVDEYWAPELANERKRSKRFLRQLMASRKKCVRATSQSVDLAGRLKAAERQRDELAAFVHAVRNTLGLVDLHGASPTVLMSDTLTGARNTMAALVDFQSATEFARD